MELYSIPKGAKQLNVSRQAIYSKIDSAPVVIKPDGSLCFYISIKGMKYTIQRIGGKPFILLANKKK